MTERYTAVEGSQSAHCCFEWTVVDTTRPVLIHGKQYAGQFEPVCETFLKEDAQRIVDALNAAPAVQAAGMQTCEHCGGTGEIFTHAEDCQDDLCALNGDMHSCAGRVERCACTASVQIEEAGYALLADLAGIDCYGTNLRDQPAAYEALDRYRRALAAAQDHP